jgi:hypothetical protein
MLKIGHVVSGEFVEERLTRFGGVGFTRLRGISRFDRGRWLI